MFLMFLATAGDEPAGTPYPYILPVNDDGSKFGEADAKNLFNPGRLRSVYMPIFLASSA